MNNQVKLAPKLVGEIIGEFIIPDYQRGYRWDKEQVEQLLNDIWGNGANSYCLQPIVVKPQNEGCYEVIDGQQRLTTLYLLLNFIKHEFKPRIEIGFSIKYATRPQSEGYLQNPDPASAETFIDYFHIFKAHEAIKKWFGAQPNDVLAADEIYIYLCKNVKIIWYEAGADEDSTNLFTRLNIGKIPLTNAELIKALLLSKDSGQISNDKQIEIASTWDTIEHSLHDGEFWAFLTNRRPSEYATRIELIFDMMAKKGEKEKEVYFTFFRFSEQIAGGNKTAIDLWDEVKAYYHTLREWYDNRDIFHKVGYLIASGTPLQTIIDSSKGKRKSEFSSSLNDQMRNCLNITWDEVDSLSYEVASDKARIENVLLLMNIETMRTIKDSQQRFSFKAHKSKRWSLEHIHAQNSMVSQKKEDWQQWLDLHRDALRRVDDPDRKALAEELLHEIELKYAAVSRPQFDDLSARITDVLSEHGKAEPLHAISNMALLSSGDNSALSNSTFQVKRDEILRKDRNGEYIPICTKKIFLKYYTPSDKHQLQFWSNDDRQAYMEEMKHVLSNYLSTQQ